MKHKLLYIFLTTILLTGCAAQKQDEMPPAQNLNRLQTETQASPGDIRLISAKTNLKLGENGSITIQGDPGVTYDISSSYKWGTRTITALQSKAAGPDGRVTWFWSVNRNTLPGTYPITISGGGATFITSYTVSK